MFLSNIDEYRSIPFWSWNDKLDNDILKAQISLMKDAGIGGFIMHARGGLETPYMGDLWFESIDECTDYGVKEGMLPFAYDENGWPSGFANGRVTDLGEKYHQKYLRVEEGNKYTDRTIANVEGYHIYYDVNVHYVDLLMPETTDKFIEYVYEYYVHRNPKVKGFFTDEPQLSRNGYPWSIILPDEYLKEYGENLLDKLPELFFEIGDYVDTRMKYWRLVTRLFSKNFFEKLYTYLDNYNIALTGHVLYEETLGLQLTPNGAAMPHFRYFHIPGIDILGRDIEINKLTSYQTASVAAQFGKKKVLSECYALTGWGIGFDEIISMFDWQAVRGINYICNHLSAYSLRGIRKRDYPPSFFYQQPWWKYYNLCTDYLARVGFLLGEGKKNVDTLVIHPQTSAWITYNGNYNNPVIDEYNDKFIDVIDKLEQNHILFHLGDETIIEDSAYVDNGRFVIGECSYSKIIIPPNIRLFDKTTSLIGNFVSSGGSVLDISDIKPSGVCDNPCITYNSSVHDDYTVHFFVNSTDEEQKVTISAGDSIYDAHTDEIKPFKSQFILPAKSSIITLEGVHCEPKDGSDKTALSADSVWKIETMDSNILVLDKCKCWIDNKFYGDDVHILDVGEAANSFGREVNVRIESHFKAEYVPDKLYLVCETPEIFTISVNGNRIPPIDEGSFITPAMKKFDISSFVHTGDNIIETSCDFKQQQQVYDDINVIHECEVVKNKFTYTMEIEAMYLVGDFSLSCPGEFTYLDKDSLRYNGEFIISEPKQYISSGKLAEDGYPFFGGNVTLSQDVEVTDTHVKFAPVNLWSTVASVNINGSDVGLLYKNPKELDISRFLHKGTNHIEVTLTNSLRNLMGPHHMEQGECIRVCPSSFYKDTLIWGDEGRDKWNDGYCFIKNGFEI